MLLGEGSWRHWGTYSGRDEGGDGAAGDEAHGVGFVTVVTLALISN